jgi:drug/metabolite transporter (DMT)-like permease
MKPWRWPAVSWTTVLLLTLPPLIWAGNAVIGRAARTEVPPFHLNFLRWSFAGLALLPFVANDLKAAWPQVRKSLAALMLMSFFGVTCYNSFQYLALTTTTPINTSLIGSSGPVFSLLLGVLFFGQKLKAGQVLGAIISLVGVAFVMLRGDIGRLASIAFERGDLYMLVATLFWAAYTWLVRTRRPELSMSMLLFAQIVFGLLWALPAVLFESATTTVAVSIDLKLVAIIAYISLMASLFAYFCWDRGVSRAGAALPMFFNNLTPVFAGLISTVALNEAPQPYHAVGLVLILAGIVLASRNSVRPQTS